MINDIVLYKGEPALVVGETQNGKGVVLRFPKHVFKCVLKEYVKAYTGDKDAVTLGLKEAE